MVVELVLITLRNNCIVAPQVCYGLSTNIVIKSLTNQSLRTFGVQNSHPTNVSRHTLKGFKYYNI